MLASSQPHRLKRTNIPISRGNNYKATNILELAYVLLTQNGNGTRTFTDALVALYIHTKIYIFLLNVTISFAINN